MNKLPWVCNREAHPPSLSFPRAYLCGPRPASYRYSPAALPLALESITDTKADTSPHVGLGHLSCCHWRTQQNLLTIMSAQRAGSMHGPKQCKVHSSKGCVKNISAPKSLTASRMCVIRLFFISRLAFINGFVLVSARYKLIIIRPSNRAMLHTFERAFTNLLSL